MLSVVVLVVAIGEGGSVGSNSLLGVVMEGEETEAVGVVGVPAVAVLVVAVEEGGSVGSSTFAASSTAFTRSLSGGEEVVGMDVGGKGTFEATSAEGTTTTDCIGLLLLYVDMFGGMGGRCCVALLLCGVVGKLKEY